MKQTLQNAFKSHSLPKIRLFILGVCTFVVAISVILFFGRGLVNLALIDAAQKGQLNSVKVLLGIGADPNAEDEGQTPLIMAVEERHIKIAQLLISKGAAIDTRGTFGDTALNSTIGSDATLVQFLLEKGADINSQDDDGKTLLMKAASNADIEITRLLLLHNASVNLRDSNGQTALMQATSVDYPVNSLDLIKTVDALINHGSDINAEDKNRQTALTLSRSYKHPNVTQMLVEAGQKQSGSQ